jgi:hypothetical protein
MGQGNRVNTTRERQMPVHLSREERERCIYATHGPLIALSQGWGLLAGRQPTGRLHVRLHEKAVTMPAYGSAILVLVLLCASAGVGIYIRPHLPERHRARESVELMQLVIGMLVTFAALVLGLLTASVKNSYDAADHARHEYALQLTQLDRCLRDYGPATDAARAGLRSYAAAVIASTWPSEPPPAGVPYPSTVGMPRVGASPVLADLMNQIGIDINSLDTSNVNQARIAELCREEYRDVIRARMDVIEEASKALSTPFYRILIFWLMVIFASFGLVAPRHSLSVISIGLCAISLSSAIFVILELNEPYTGLITISSDTMRTALHAMMAPGP